MTEWSDTGIAEADEHLMDRQLDLSIAIRSSESASTRMSFVEPLSVEDQYFIKWLSERYEGRSGAPIMTFSCDGILTLVCPTDLQRKRADESKSVKAATIHGVPSNG